MMGYLPNDWTSCALTGFVATILRAGADEWNDLVAEARGPLASIFLSIPSRMSRATTTTNEEGEGEL